MDVISSIKGEFSNWSEDIEHFYAKSSDDNFKHLVKQIYDECAQSDKLNAAKTKGFRKLLVDGFDEEQIFQQIELQNRNLEVLKRFDGQMLSGTPLIKGKHENFSKSKHTTSSREHTQKKKTVHFEEQNSEADADFSSDSEGYQDFKRDRNLNLSNDEMNEDDEMDEDDEFGDESDEEEEMPKKKKVFKEKVTYTSEVDDQFFKLSKLDQFLRFEDLKEERGDELESDSDDDDEEQIDLFQDIPSDDDDDDGGEENESSKDPMYADFFDAPDSENEQMEDADESALDENNFDEAEDYAEDADEAEDFAEDDYEADDYAEDNVEAEDYAEDNVEAACKSENDANKESDEPVPPIQEPEQVSRKTPFQIAQEKIDKEISQYEKKLLLPKPWHLTGEVDKLKRPEDALLYMDTNFDVNAKPVVVQDQSLADKFESMIKLTIKNKSYSDGVRQYKTAKENIAYTKETVIDSNKSKDSLAQVYEEMYLKNQKKQQGIAQEEGDKKVEEIKKLMGIVIPHIQALFSEIPKAAVPDIKIVSNLPAITVEEVAPTSVSDAMLLAPEEVKARTGQIKDKTERTDTDKKRERRLKKIHQKRKYQKQTEEGEGKPLNAKETKEEKLALLKKVKQHRKTTVAKVSGDKIKTSKDFFDRLQETVSTTRNKKQSLKKKM